MLRSPLLLIAVCLVSFMTFLDYTIVNTALPVIQHDLQANVLMLQWVSNIYFLVISVTMVIFGRVADIWGYRRLYLAGAIGFIISSFILGFSSSLGVLILFRGLQSASLAATITVTPVLLSHVYGDKAHHKLSIYGAVCGVALALGPMVGGWVTTYFGWRWIFWINVPVALIALSVAWRLIPAFKGKCSRLDVKGMVLLAIANGSLVYGLIHGEQFGWHLWQTWAFLLIALVAYPSLYWVEKYTENPLYRFDFFRKPLFLNAALCCAIAGFLSGCFLFFDPLYLHVVRGFSAAESGYILLGIPVMVGVFSPLLGRLIRRFGIDALLIFSFITGMLAAALHLTYSVITPIWLLALPMLFIGVSWAICIVGAAIAAQQAVSAQEGGAAVGTVYSMFNIFGSVVLAISVVLFHARRGLFEATGKAQAFLHGFHSVVWLLLGLTISALLVVMWGYKRAAESHLD